MSSAAKLNE